MSDVPAFNEEHNRANNTDITCRAGDASQASVSIKHAPDRVHKKQHMSADKNGRQPIQRKVENLLSPTIKRKPKCSY